MANPRICSIDGCGKPLRARGWCVAHYERWRRHGAPDAGGTAHGEPLRYFHEAVIAFDGDECLIWPYGRSDDGYARMCVDGRNVLVHRQACEAVHGAAPAARRESAHSCGNGHLGCVNPTHTRWATHQENKADELIHGTSNRGSRNGAAKLTESDVLRMRQMIGTMPRREIAELFNVACVTVTLIHLRKTWAWL